jgi:uncharacterized membrane protein YdjX (TVP38/TMEM64 family)
MKLRLVFLVAIAALLLALFASGSFERFDAAALRSWILEARFWGPALYVLLFAALEPFGFPGMIFLLTAIFVWPAWQAFLLIWAGSVGACIVGYSLARWIARDWVLARLPARFLRLESWVATNGLLAVIGTRLVFFIFQPSLWALGLTRVSFPTLLLGSVIGVAPASALFAFAGAAAIAWLQEQPPETFAFALAGGLAAFLVVRRVLARRAAASGVAPGAD